MKVVPEGAEPHFAGTLPAEPANTDTAIVYVKVQSHPEQNVSGAPARLQIAGGQGWATTQV